MNKTKVVIADDHSVLRDSLKSALKLDDSISVVGEAKDGLEAIELVSKHRPELVLMDINMPYLDGIVASHEIKQKFPETKILLLTMHDNKQYIFSALQAGIEGYILKMSNLKQVIEAMHIIINGDTFFDSSITEILKDKLFTSPPHKNNYDIYSYFGITNREKDIIDLIITGYTTQEIADKLNISVHTASNHRTRLLKKLNLKNTAELIVFAIKEGLYSV